MYNDTIRESVIQDLENKEIAIVELAISLVSQGYFVNKTKYIRLDWSSIILNAFENIDVFNADQQHKLELIYNKLSTI